MVAEARATLRREAMQRKKRGAPMSIIYKLRRAGMFPVFICDVCQDIIQDARLAIVAWTENGDIAFAHRGECSHALDWKAGFPYWDDLDIFLVSLSINTGCDLKGLKDAKKRHGEFVAYGLAATDIKAASPKGKTA
jgi:hypothetical protein